MPPNRQNPHGEPIQSLLVEERLEIAKEAYCAITIDRAARKPVFMVSRFGGMDIEDVSEHHPESIAKFYVDIAVGYSPFIGRELAFAAELDAGYRKQFPAIAGALYDVFFRYGAKLVEINPLALTADGRVVASDAKVELDDDALFRNPEFDEWRSALPLDEDELLAAGAGVGIRNFRRFPGDVGTMANGAGLAMATMDAVANAGGGVADFLDVGGGANAQRVRNCYELVVNNTGAKSFFINIFGGITRGDEVARGIVSAMEETTSRKIPLVIRLTGTNEEEGRRILAAAGMTPVRNHGRGRERSGPPGAGGLTMAIFLDKNSRVIVQGITGAEGSYHAGRMFKYGTNLVGGVTPGKGGRRTPEGLPVFDTVREAVEATGATHTCIFVPPPFAADALYEAYDAGITFAVCITEGVPVHDTLKVVATTPGMRIIGPNCPGLVVAREGADRHHAGPRVQGRRRGRDVALGHPDLRGGRPADPRGPRPVHLRRDRGRPDHRHDLRGLPARVQERPRDHRGGGLRRDRRIGRRGCRGVHRRAHARDARRGLHRRPQRPARQVAGPRRGDHLRQVRHPGEQDRGLYRRRRPRRRTAVRDPRPSSRALGGPRLSKRASAGRFPP